jgi:AcrR family transcriptional regulator
VSQGILHYYFRDKRAILAAAAGHVMDDLDLRVKSESANRRDASSRFRAMIRACLAVANRGIGNSGLCSWPCGVSPARSGIGVDSTRPRISGRAMQSAESSSKACGRGISSRSTSFTGQRDVLALIDGISLQLTFDRNLMTVRKAERLCEEVLFEQHIGK